jgi:hypothetical protein
LSGRALVEPPCTTTDDADRLAVERAILQAVAYADVFDYPLTAGELHRYLIGVAASESSVSEALMSDRLFPALLANTAGFYTLAGRESAVETRTARAAVSDYYWNHGLRYGRIIGALPFVRMVAVTGALAVDNVADGDIDYLIVTEPGRLWVCRAIVIGLVRVAAVRGVTLCPNYFLSERALVLEERSLFTAHEVTQMVPITGLDTYQRLRELNRWTDTFLPNAAGPPRHFPLSSSVRRQPRAAVETALRTRLGQSLEDWEMSRKLRKLGARGNGHEEAAFGPDWCKGHFGDHGQLTLSRFGDRWLALQERLA